MENLPGISVDADASSPQHTEAKPHPKDDTVENRADETAVTTVQRRTRGRRTYKPQRHFLRTNVMLVVSDGQGRGLGQAVQRVMDEKVCVWYFVYYGGMVGRIVRDNFEYFIKHRLNKNDMVVLLAGSNDINGRPSRATGEYVINAYEDAIKRFRNTNLVVVTVPHRYDLSISCTNNSVIKNTNLQIASMVSRYGYVQLLDVSCLPRNCYSYSGCLFSLRGKRMIAKNLQKMFEDKNLPVNERRFKLPA